MKRALLDAIAAAPDDDGPRLVYADWLAERNDGLGEFIVAQCALARGAEGPRAEELRARAAELERELAWKWLSELAPLAPREKWQWRFERGFLADLTLKSRSKLRDAGATALGACECLFMLQRLSLTSQQIGPAGARALAASRSLARLVALDLTSNRLGLRGLAALARSSTLHRLAELDVRNCELYDDRTALPRSLRLPALRRLHLGTNPISARVIEALAPWLARLEHLDLSAWLVPGPGYLFGAGDDPTFQREGLAALAAAPLGKLRVLDLGKSAFGNPGIEQLVASRSLTSLEKLALNSTAITAAGIAALCAAAPRLPALVHLDLWDNPISDAGARALCDSPLAARLETLEAGSWRRYNPYGPSEELLTPTGRALLRETFGDRVRFSDSHR